MRIDTESVVSGGVGAGTSAVGRPGAPASGPSAAPGRVSGGPVVSHSPVRGMAGGVGMLLLTMLIWGTQFPVAKSAFEHIDSFHTAVFRYGVGVLVLLAILLLREGISVLRFNAQGRDAAAIGLIGMFGSPALVFTGLMYCRPETTAIIVAVQPALTAVVEWLVRGRRPGGFSLACIVLAFVGVVTAITRWDLSMLSSSPTELSGNILVFSGCLCWVFYTVASSDFKNWSVLRLTTLTMLSGTLGHLGLAVILTVTGAIATPTLVDWMAASNELLFLAFAGVLVAMVCWNAGTARIGPLNAMLFVNLVPVITFAVRYLQGYRFHVLEIVGAAMVIAALVANNIALRMATVKSEKAARSALTAKSPMAAEPDNKPSRAVMPVMTTRMSFNK